MLETQAKKLHVEKEEKFQESLFKLHSICHSAGNSSGLLSTKINWKVVGEEKRGFLKALNPESWNLSSISNSVTYWWWVWVWPFVSPSFSVMMTIRYTLHSFMKMK